MATNTVKLMVDGVLEESLVRTDANGEYACKTRSGRVFFFPKGSDLVAEVKKHNAANSTKPVLAEDVENTDDSEWNEWDA